MRIALVHTRYRLRGGEDVAFGAEAQLLAARGHDVHVIEADNADLDDVTPATAAFLAVWNDGRRQELADHLHALDPDIVHFHNTFPLLSPAVLYAVPPRAAAVQTLHNYRLVCPAATLLRGLQPCETCVGRVPYAAVRHGCYRGSRLASATVAGMLQLHRIMGTYNRRIDAFIALSTFARSVFVRGGLPADRVHVKPNFVDPDPGAGPHDGKHYLFAGRLDRQKGVDVLLDAATRAGLPVRMIGAGPLEAEVRNAVATHRHIEYLGVQSRERVLTEMQSARALLLPSISFENFPLVIAEAFATGLPIISSSLDNLADLTARRGAGWTFGAGDAADLARVLQFIDTRATERNAASRRARQLFEAEYTSHANYDQLMRIYQTARGRKVKVA